VTPRRVVIARCLKKGGNTNVKFHRMERLQVISVAAGVMHSTALTVDGALFYWYSSDPDLRCQQVRLLPLELLPLKLNYVFRIKYKHCLHRYTQCVEGML
jgi:hypothetical protein